MFKDVNWLLVLVPIALGVLFIISWNDIQLGLELKQLKDYYVNHNCTLLSIQYYELNDSITITQCSNNNFLSSGASFVH